MSPTLVVLAAGMGSRYGGIKQIEAIGPNNESLIDYSIYNAIQAGFKKIVMVIRKDIEHDIKAFFEGRIPSHIPVHWVFQELDAIPEGFTVPAHRNKPWGTGQALLVCKEVIQEPFAMINGDDYYAYEALQKTASFLTQVDNSSSSYAIVGYELQQTLSDHGSVSRGVCMVDGNNNLTHLHEHKKIITKDNKIISEHDDDPTKNQELSGTEPVSMNLFGFTPTFLTQLETGFTEFLQHNQHEEKEEFFVPAYLGELIHQGRATATLFSTSAQWFGITYQADKPKVEQAIRDLIDNGTYPSPLWS